MTKRGLKFRMWWRKQLEQIPFWSIIIFWAIIATVTFCSLLWLGAVLGNIIKEDRKHQHEHNV